MIFKCGWPILVLRSLAAFAVAKVMHTAVYLGQLVRGRMTKRIYIGIRFKIFFRLFYIIPEFIPKRVKIRSGRKIRDRQVREWFRDFK